MEFLALDVETSNADYSSICQIGIVEVCNGNVANTWSTLVNPEAYFDPFNISIHGITEEQVRDAPTFDKVHEELNRRLSEKVIVHHMPFDRIAMDRACNEYELQPLRSTWLDSAKIVRRTWEEFAYKGYGLKNVASFLEIDFSHHDALEDATAAAKIVISACGKTGLSIEEWVERVSKPISTLSGGTSSKVKLDGNPDGPLYGEKLVFTGALFMPRKEAAQIAADLGCNVVNSVSKKTTILVVGTQDATKLGGYEKSSKHRKAEDLIEQGSEIKILSEKDFIEMCNNEKPELQMEMPEKEEKKSDNAAKKVPEDRSMSISISLDTEGIAEAVSEAWDSLPEETKQALHKADKERQEFLKSIKDCSHEKKREMSKSFKSNLERVQSICDENQYEDIADSILNEAENLNDALFDFMKNKMSLATFFEALTDSISYIQDDMEDAPEDSETDFAKGALDELESIKERILSQVAENK